MLHTERIDRFMFQLPRNHRTPVPVSLSYPPYELRCSGQEGRVGCRPHQGTLPEWSLETMHWYEELGIAEVLDRADRQDDVLAGSLGGFELPVELARIELARATFDPIPVRSEPNQVERVCKEGRKSCFQLQAECLNLPRPKADTEQGRAARPDR
jgi:hypothetical protein